VLVGILPEKIQQAAEMYAGCLSGVIQKQTWLEIIEVNGFQNIKIQKEKPVIVPDDILGQYLTEPELVEFKESGTGIFSITVFAEKPSVCCGSECSN
jgi:hypothetical protein